MSETPDMVERVARAIYEKFEDRPAYARRQMNGIIAEELARAGIEAMRVPTDAMLEKGPPEPYMDAQVWVDMIDAALTAKPTSSTA